MGNSNSTETMNQLYMAYGGSVTGGDESQTPRVIGGLDGVKEYANTIMSHAKQKLIRDIARDMKAKFRIEGKGASKVTINPDADLSTLVDQLKKAIPNPEKNGRVFSSKLGTQKKACKTLAQIINNRFGFKAGAGIIDENADPAEICEKVSEVMYTLFTGMHGEFLAVRSDAERLLKNLHHLHEILDRNYKHLQDKLSKADPGNVMTETKLAREGHDSILKEMKRQQVMLENMLNVVVTPQDKAMAKLLKETKEYKRLVQDIKKLPGSGKFGEKLSYVLSGIGTTAQMAAAVDDALRTISMSAAEYGRQKNMKDLEESVFDKLQGKLKGSSAEDLQQYMKAARTLFKYEYNRPEIVKQLGRTGSAEDQDVDGGASRIQGGLKVDKRVKQRQDLKKALVKAFNKRLNIHLENINRSVKAIAEGTGTTVPITDNLRKFTKRLELIPSLEKRHIYYALTGYYRDASSKAERELFLGNVKALTDVLESMVKQKEYSGNGNVKDLLREWKSLSQMVEDYADKFEKGFGDIGYKTAPSVHEGADESDVDGGEVTGGAGWGANALKPMMQNVLGDSYTEENYEKAKEYIKQQGSNLISKVQEAWQNRDASVMKEFVKDLLDGSKNIDLSKGKSKGFFARLWPFGSDQEGDIEGGAGDDLDAGVEITRLAYTLDKAKETMRYFFRIADIRENLKSIKVEQKHYGEDYEKVLGDAVARARDDISKNMVRDLKALREGGDDTSATPNFRYTALKDYLKTDQNANPAGLGMSEDKAKETLKKLASFKEHHYNTKINMLKCAEAVDLYMKHFTDGIVSNVDDISKIETMLRGTDIISKWFTKRSGNLITCVFDTFPSMYNGANAQYSNLNRNWDHKRMGDDLHYYWRVQATCHATTPANAHANIVDEAGKLATASSDLPSKLYGDGAAAADWNTWQQDKLQEGLKHADNMIVGTNEGLPGMPYLALPPIKDVALGGDDDKKWRNGEKVLEMMQKAFENVSVLKNLIAAFVAIGSRFGGEELKNKTNMRPVHIYKCLIDYMSMGSLNIGLDLDAAGAPNGVKEIDLGESYLANQGNTSLSNVAGGKFQAGATGQAGVWGTDEQVRKNLYVAMRHANADAGMINLHGKDVDSDQLFTLVVKAMMAKILTVIGVYNMLHKPIDKQGLGYNSYTRFTIGGVDLGTPDVIPEAFELYVRLPLLAEFYREVFRFDKKNDQGDYNPILSMVPEMDGTFRGLVELIFDRAKHVQYGTYSETDVKTIVQEVNKIYMKYKGSKKVVHDVVHAFIAEINRRYGILVREERTRYIDEMNARYRNRFDSPGRTEDRADYDILDEEEYGDSPAGPGPSDSYVQVGTIPGTVRDHKWTIRLETHQQYINQLRSNIDKKFKDTWNAADPLLRGKEGLEHLKTLSFENLIKARTEELRYAKDKKSQFRVVMQSINGLGEFSMNAQERSIILFHETVVTGLNTMYGLYRLVEKFRSEIFKMGKSVKAVKAWASGNYDNAAEVRTAIRDAFPVDNTEALDATDRDLAYQDFNEIVNFKRTNGATADIPFIRLCSVLVGNDANKADAGARFGLNSQKMYTKLAELLFGHCSSLDGLVTCQIEAVEHPDLSNRDPTHWLIKALKDNNVSDADKPKSLAIALDHSKLMDLVESEMNYLRATIDKFRGLIPKKVIDSYEAFKDGSGNEQVGSYYWLEKHLVFETLMGKVEKWEDKHLNRVNDQVRTITEYLFKPYRFNAAGLHANNANPAPVAIYDQNNYYGALSNMVSFNHWSHGVENSSQNAIAVNAGDLTILLGTPPNSQGNRDVLPALAGKYLHPLYDHEAAALSNHDELRSILFSFNKLLAAYLHQFFDRQSEKIYLGVIDKFANGAFSEFVMGTDKQFKDYNDNAGNAANNAGVFSHDGDIKSVLYASLAAMLRNLLTGKVAGKTYKHWLETDLAEIPLFMKENFKANMPVFHKLFTFLSQKARMLKHFTDASHVAYDAGDNGNAAPVSEVESKKRMQNVLDQVMIGCSALINCMGDVMEELADSPVYLETHKDSIKEYEAANGSKPIMPLSSLLVYMRDRKDRVSQRSAYFQVGGNDNLTGDKTMPRFNMGSTEFKMLYGTRGILAQGGSYGLDKLPGMKDILKAHNETTEAEYHCDEKSLADHVNNTLLAARYMINGSHYKSLLSVINESKSAVNYDDQAYTPWKSVQYWATSDLDNNGRARFKNHRGAVVDANPGAMSYLFNHLREPLQRKTPLDTTPIDGLTFSLQNNVLPVIQITTDVDQRAIRQKLVRVVEEVDKTIVRGTRDQIRTLNIIDMNVVPINIHALMREIPLVNLYNYAHTFDSMICSLLGVSQDLRDHIGAPGAGNRGPVTSIEHTLSKYPEREKARKVLGWMIIHPYGEMSVKEYEKYFSRIVRGAIGIDGLGRPKFLGDQLYNKALFGEVYGDHRDYDEAGSAVGHGRGVTSMGAYRATLIQQMPNNNSKAWANSNGNQNQWNALVDKALNPSVTDAEMVVAAQAAQGQGNDLNALDANWWANARQAALAAASREPTNRGREDRFLHYLHKTKDGKSQIVGVDVGKLKPYLQRLGKARFDTFYCRSLIWMTNLQRALRLKLRRDLHWYDSKVVRDGAVMSPSITELYGNDSALYNDHIYRY